MIKPKAKRPSPKLTMLRPTIPVLKSTVQTLQDSPNLKFYSTKEWRAARELCYALHAYRCAKCGRQARRLFADHIQELKDGGAPFDQSNLMAMCGACHTTKTAAERAKRHRQTPTPGGV